MILVAGGAGFLGATLCEKLLLQGNKVLCIDSIYTGNLSKIEYLSQYKYFKFIHHDIISPFNLSTYRIKEIYNLACPASPDFYQKDEIYTLDTNYLGTKNLLELSKKHSAKFLLASTSEIYGDPLISPQNETYYGNTNTTGARSCYDEGKRVAESLTYSYGKKYNLNIKIARIFNVYGPGMLVNDGRVISNFIVNTLKKEPLTIYGKGKQTRSFCFVDDTINGLIKLMSSNYNQPINLGNNIELEINYIANIIFQLLNTEVPIIYKSARENDPLQRKPDILLAQQQLNWYPKVDLFQGLIKTIKYFQKELGIWKIN